MTPATRLGSRRFLAALAAVLTVTWGANVQAHCNTVDGPVASMDCSALNIANMNPVPAVHNRYEVGMHNPLGKTVAIRAEGGVARDPPASRSFETLVRMHREWEGHLIAY